MPRATGRHKALDVTRYDILPDIRGRTKLEQVAVLFLDGGDEFLDVGGELTGAQSVVLDFVQADTNLVVCQEEEAEVLGVYEVFLGLEDGELILAGLCVVGAECGAVATLVAHSVDMQDLRFFEERNIDNYICSVRTYVSAYLAYG